MAVSDRLIREAKSFVRGTDAEFLTTVRQVIELIDPSGAIRSQLGPSWAVNMHERILFANRMFNNRPLTREELEFLTFHEGGHLLFTDPDFKVPADVKHRKVFKEVWNACEDMRMERQVGAKFPGFEQNRRNIAGQLLYEAVQSTQEDIVANGNVARATWMEAMGFEYWNRWPHRRNDPDNYMYRTMWGFAHRGQEFFDALRATLPDYRKAAEQPTMAKMMPIVRRIYDALLPYLDGDKGGDGEDGGEDEGDPGEGEGGEGGGETGTETTEGEDTTEGGEAGDGEQDGEAEGGSSSSEDGDDDAEGEQDEGDTDAEGDDDDAKDGDDGEGDDSSDDESDADGDEPGKGAGNEEGTDDPSGESEDAQSEGEQDVPEDDEGDELTPVNVFEEGENDPTKYDIEDQSSVNGWKNAVDKGVVSQFSGIMRNMLRANEVGALRRGLYAGNVDTKRWDRMVTAHEYNIFQKKDDPEAPRYALIISVDTSGSMSGKPSDDALRAAATMAEAWRKLKLPFTVFGWGSSVNYIVTDKSRNHVLDIAHQRRSSGGGTSEAAAVNMAFEVAMRYASQGYTPLWFHVTDGQAYDTEQAKIDTFVRSFGAGHLYFVGIGGYPAGRFPNVLYMRNSADLLNYMRTVVRRQVSRERLRN